MKARILIIEDNPINLELVTFLLRAFGYDTRSAADGLAGLAAAREEPPDLILCDIQMPGMDGLEFARHVKADARLRRLPLVALTAYAMVGDEDRILAAGFDDYIAKPIDPNTFVGTVSRLLEHDTTSPAIFDAIAPAASPAPWRRGPHILVLDDEPTNLDLARSLLGPHGYDVQTVSTIAEAMAALQVRVPELIISDVGMEQGDGFAFIQLVKADERLRDVPFLFISASHWNPADRELGLRLGARRYLLRPLDPQTLLAEVQACLRGR